MLTERVLRPNLSSQGLGSRRLQGLETDIVINHSNDYRDSSRREQRDAVHVSGDPDSLPAQRGGSHRAISVQRSKSSANFWIMVSPPIWFKHDFIQKKDIHDTK